MPKIRTPYIKSSFATTTTAVASVLNTRNVSLPPASRSRFVVTAIIYLTAAAAVAAAAVERQAAAVVVVVAAAVERHAAEHTKHV